MSGGQAGANGFGYFQSILICSKILFGSESSAVYQHALALCRTHEHGLCDCVSPSLTIQRKEKKMHPEPIIKLVWWHSSLYIILAQGKPRTKFEEWGVASLGDGVASWEHGVI